MTKASGKSHVVQFRFACNKHLRYSMYWFSFVSLNDSEWANLTIAAKGIKDTTILKRCGLWEPSGSKLSL